MKEEVLRIMKMVEEGKIDAEKAAELIEALKVSKGGDKGGVVISSSTTQNSSDILKDWDSTEVSNFKESPGFEGFKEFNKFNKDNIDLKMLKVKVISSTKDNVNIQVPVKFIKNVLAACGKMPMNIQGMEGFDMNMIVEAIDSGLTGKIVDVKSGNGDIVEVVIE